MVSYIKISETIKFCDHLVPLLCSALLEVADSVLVLLDEVSLNPILVEPGPGLGVGLGLILVAIADPVLVLLEEVGLDPVPVDPGPGLLLGLVEAVAGALVVAAGGLGLGLVVVADPVANVGLGLVAGAVVGVIVDGVPLPS